MAGPGDSGGGRRFGRGREVASMSPRAACVSPSLPPLMSSSLSRAVPSTVPGPSSINGLKKKLETLQTLLLLLVLVALAPVVGRGLDVDVPPKRGRPWVRPAALLVPGLPRRRLRPRRRAARVDPSVGREACSGPAAAVAVAVAVAVRPQRVRAARASEGGPRADGEGGRRGKGAGRGPRRASNCRNEARRRAEEGG